MKPVSRAIPLVLAAATLPLIISAPTVRAASLVDCPSNLCPAAVNVNFVASGPDGSMTGTGTIADGQFAGETVSFSSAATVVFEPNNTVHEHANGTFPNLIVTLPAGVEAGDLQFNTSLPNMEMQPTNRTITVTGNNGAGSASLTNPNGNEIQVFTGDSPATSFVISGDGFSGSGSTGIGFTELKDIELSDLTAVIPLPAALPLFASGLGAFGLLGWRRKRRVKAVA